MSKVRAALSKASSRAVGRIVPRRVAFQFREHDIPVHWFDDNVVASHGVNGLNLVFPAGERFFIRSVRHFLDAIEDDDLRAEATKFFKQEAQHGYAHEQAFRLLEEQGFEIQSWLDWFEHTAFDQLEPQFPKVWALSATAALEHLTASMAHFSLTRDHLDRAHPVMADLLRWHAAEEIEHKSVAYDVLQEVDPRYRTRLIGMTFGVILLLAYWRSATQHLLAQDPEATRWRIARDNSKLRSLGIKGARRRVLGYALQYLRRDFHPDQLDDYALAHRFIEDLKARREVHEARAAEA